MQTKKMNLADLHQQLSRDEMKQIVGGSTSCTSNADCSSGIAIKCAGKTKVSGSGRCYNSGNGMVCHWSVAC